MPIKHAIWKVAEKPEPLATTRLVSEQFLEEMIVAAPSILSSEWMLIGQQEPTGMGGRIDLLAIAPDASLVLIELKRDRTPRDIVAQALDYASWVEDLETENIAQIYHRFSKGRSLDADFRERFGIELDEEALNESHQIIIVASELDPATERIIAYLDRRDIAVNAVFFQVFQNGDEQLLSRAWLIDPGDTQANVTVSTRSGGEKEPWNGEYYVSFGGPLRIWEEARKYGFISAGGGLWYSQTLDMLSPGDRIWVNIPKVGYVGVGVVTQESTLLDEFTIKTSEGERPILEMLHHADEYRHWAKNDDTAERFVRVDWLDTVTEANAIKEAGFFGNQNTVCRPQKDKWRHTVERLKTKFPNWNRSG